MHVAAVAEGLAALGHEVTALVTRGAASRGRSAVRWVPLPPPFGSTAPAAGPRAARSARLAARSGPTRSSSVTTTSAARPCAARQIGAAAVLEVNAPVDRLPRLEQGAARPRAAGRADAALARTSLRAGRRHRHAEPVDPSRRGSRRSGSTSSNGAPTPTVSARACDGAGPVRAARCRRRWRSSPVRSARGTAPFIWSRRSRTLRRRGHHRNRRGLRRGRSRAARVRAAAAGIRSDS